MKIFISYKFDNENPTELEAFMNNIKSALNKSNHEMITTFFDKNEFEKTKATMRQIMDRAMNYINKSDAILCIIKSKEKSEGMILEIGYAIAKNKKIILAIQKGIESRWIKHYSEKIIEFETLQELYKKIEVLKL